MRASPAFHVLIDRFALWRVALFAMLAVTAGAWLAWLSSMHEDLGTASVVMLCLLGLGLLLLAATLARCQPLSLRWDGQRWHVGPSSTVGEEPWTGDLQVAIDLGGWMLLRLAPDAPQRRAWVRWIPVQRHGMESAWHALRCAVYSSRPSPGPQASHRAQTRHDQQE